MNGYSEHVKNALFDIKSSSIYANWIDKYLKFHESYPPNTKHSSNLFLEFLTSISERYCANTLWQCHSAVGKWLLMYENIDIKSNILIKNFLKRKSKTHLEKKSLTLNEENINDFLVNAPNNDNFLLIKCAMVVGISGLTRISELTNLDFSNLKLSGDNYEFLISQSKTDLKKKGFTFIVVPPFSHYITNYVNVFPLELRKGRFFRKIINGAPSQAAVGKNTLASYPKLVAEFLGLENSEQYTGHCLRRTGATILADRGVSKITLKRAGRWTSDSVCDGYIAESSTSKLTIANALVNQANNNNVSKSDNDKGVKNIYISNTTGNVVINL
jgi:integrase